jgi:hypothetical protein
MGDLISIPSMPQLSAVEVYYDNKLIVPAPLIEWVVESQFNNEGTRESNVHRLTLTGSTIIVPSGSYEQLYVKQQALRDTFSVDYRDFVIKAGPGNRTLPSGSVISSGLRPRINNINITPDIQVLRFDWTVEMQGFMAASGISGVVSSLSNSWTFREEQDSCTLSVSHQVSAEGPEGQPDKFEQAVEAVKPLLGIQQLPIALPYFAQPNFSGMFGMTHPANPSGGPIFEVSVQREEVADVANGSYSVTEVFTIVSGVPFYYTTRTESFEEDINGIAQVTIAGSVQGLGRTLVPGTDVGGVGFARAASGFVNYVRPQLPWDASGVYYRYKLNSGGLGGSGLALFNPTTFSVSQNKCRGTVDFSITFTDDPSKNLPSGIASRQNSVNIVEGIRLQVSHAIPFRRLGSIVQDIATTTDGTIAIQCQAQAKNTGFAKDDTNRAIAFVQDELNRLKSLYVNPALYVTARITGLNQQVSDAELTCTANLEIAFTVDLAIVPNLGSTISLRTIS